MNGQTQRSAAPAPRSTAVRLGETDVHIASPGRTPFRLDAVVKSEDTFLIMNAAPMVRSVGDAPLRVWTAAQASRPVPPGTVLYRDVRPIELCAVIYDFDAEDICTVECVGAALRGVFDIARQRSLRSIAMPLLGATHGYLDEHEVAAVFRESFAEQASHHPRGCIERLWLMVPLGTEEVIGQCLCGQGN